MVVQLFFWLLGTLKIKIVSRYPERFLNAALQHGFELWQVRRTESGAEAMVGARGYRRVRRVARESGIRPKIVAKYGLPFVLRNMVRRKWMLAGPVLFSACLYFASSLIWFVEVKGYRELSPIEIKQAAAELGLTQGAWRSTLDAQWIGRMLPLKVDGLTWSAIELNGSRAIIHVAERQTPEEVPPSRQPAHLVAAKKGKIVDIVTHMGSAAVQPGDEVEAGQLLINSYMRSETNWELEQGGPPVYPGQWVHAEGKVIAHVTYVEEAEVLLHDEIWLPVGAEQEQYSIRIANWVWDWGHPPEESVTWTDQKIWLPAPWRNSILPLELTITRYTSWQRVKRNLDPDAAADVADLQAWAALLERIPPEARILSKRKVAERVQADRVRVIWEVITEENIGRTRYVSSGEIEAQEQTAQELQRRAER